MKNQLNRSSLYLIIICLLVSLAGGLTADMLLRYYVSEKINASVLPGGEIDLTGNYLNGASIVIRDPRKVVVNQDAKVMEISNSAQASFVGFFPKLEAVSSSSTNFSLSHYYNFYQPTVFGLAFTADGWVLLPGTVSSASLLK